MGNVRPCHFPALDGLRFFCCLFVIAGHSFALHPWGAWMGRLAQMGVHVFFTLSGFLITYLLISERERTGKIGLVSFYARRFFRIFPIYYLALALCLGLAFFFQQRFTQPFGCDYFRFEAGQVAIDYGLFCANWSQLQVPTCLDVLWSISVEEQFYLFFPALLVRAKGHRQVSKLLSLALFVSYVSKLYLVLYDPSQLARNTLAVGDHLVLGAFLALAYCRRGEGLFGSWKSFGSAAEWVLLLAFVGFVVTVPEAYWLATSSALSAWLCVLIVAAATANAGPLSKVLCQPWIRWLGGLTYAAYVFHMYAVAVAWYLVRRGFQDSSWAAPVRFGLAIPMTFALAVLVRYSFEWRLLRWKERFES